MSLENLNCPQFVDFTSHETFDINDGADFFFEKGVVGELDLGGMQTQQAETKPNDRDSVEELIFALSNATNLKHPTTQIKKPPSTQNLKKSMSEEYKKDSSMNTPPPPPPLAAAAATTGATGASTGKLSKTPVLSSSNKENTNSQMSNSNKKTNSVKQQHQQQQHVVDNIASTSLDAAVSSAIEMMASAKIKNETTIEITETSKTVTTAMASSSSSSSTTKTTMMTASASRTISSSGILTTTIMTTASASAAAVSNSKKQIQMPKQTSIANNTPIQRQRTNSSTSSSGQTPNEQNQPTSAAAAAPVVVKSTLSSQPNIVKKTLAKMTAAFKHNKPVIASLNPAQSEHLSIKNKLTSKKNKIVTSNSIGFMSRFDGGGGGGGTHQTNAATNKSSSIIKEEKPVGKCETSNNDNFLILPEQSSNRRCSSVPRTLKEKQALAKSGLDIPEVNDENNLATANHHLNYSNGSLNKIAVCSVGQTKSNNDPSSAHHQPINTSTLGLISSKIGQFTVMNKTEQANNDRRRSRSVNESINAKLNGRHSRRSTNNNTNEAESGASAAKPNQTTKTTTTTTTSSTSNSTSNKVPLAKAAASPSFMQLKPRQKSAERAPIMPMYQGVRFIPKLSHKYQSFNNNNNESTTAGGVSSNYPNGFPLDELLKSRPNCLPKNTSLLANNPSNKQQQQQQAVPNIADNSQQNGTKKTTINRSTPGKSASFKQSSKHVSSTSSANSSLVLKSKNNLVKSSTSDQDLINTNNDSPVESTHLIDSNDVGGKQSETNAKANVSGIAGQQQGSSTCRIRKKSDSRNAPGSYLHTELRALKRQEYEQQIKEKERLANILKHDLELEKMRKQQEEIQKMRMQRTFKSNPIKHYKPIEVKPSEKPLTEPKSPHLSFNGSKLSNLSSFRHNNDSINLKSMSSAADALVDAPFKRVKQSKNSSLVISNGLKSRKCAVSQDDIRFDY